MTKNQMPLATTEQVLVEYIKTYGQYVLKANTNGKILRLSNHLYDLEHELLQRGTFSIDFVKQMRF